jgi:1-acyl-sn-glycerol-3-phosphate acyltransferase
VLFNFPLPLGDGKDFKTNQMQNPKSFRTKDRNWFSHAIWKVSHYLVTNLTVTIGFFFFHVFSRTTVIGRKNVPKRSKTLLLSNHLSMIDSFLVGLCAFYPESIFLPSLLPWNPAAEENFYRDRFISWFSDNWKCIPIKEGRKDLSSLNKMEAGLQTSPLLLFPEGTRSRDGSIGQPKGGAGLLILEAQPTVVPVCIVGMDKVLPIGSILPRPFKKIFIYYGPPLDLSDFYTQQIRKKTVLAVIDKVMDSIKFLRSEIDRLTRLNLKS